MSTSRDDLFAALVSGDLSRAAALIQRGADINEQDDGDETLLCRVILETEGEGVQREQDRRAVVAWMLANGADPTLRDHEGGGPLFSAVIAQDTEVMRLLLEHGANPNREHDHGEPLYDWAMFDYRWDVVPTQLADPPTEADTATEEAWLAYLDRQAVKHGWRRPDYLCLLRRYGARTGHELRRYPFMGFSRA